jgi:hypothetical protein
MIVATTENGTPASPLRASEYIQYVSDRGTDRKPPLESWPIPMLPSIGQLVTSDRYCIQLLLRTQKRHSVPQGIRNDGVNVVGIG